MGKVTATNSIEREFKEYIDKKGALYPRDVRYAVSYTHLTLPTNREV